MTRKHAMVVTQEPLAADVGLDVLRNGGNAVDAAVAVGFALAVTHPSAGNIGGGGFMLIRMADGSSTFVDFRGTAPSRATRDMFIGPDGQPTADSLYSWRAACIPGSVAGFDLALRKYGSKRWSELLDPAIRFARDGFVVSPKLVLSIQGSREHFPLTPEAKAIFTNQGRPLAAGDHVVQSDLAATLSRLAMAGAQDFYHGEIAARFARAMAEHGGLITADDMAQFHAIERVPIGGDYHGFHILTAPPPSAGGTGLLQMAMMLDNTPFATAGVNSTPAVHYGAEAMRRFYADRSEYFGDPAFYNVPVRELLDPGYVGQRRASIDPDRASASDTVQPGLPRAVNAVVVTREGKDTTHFNVVDAKGNAVAVTYTLNNSYGGGIVVPGLGFLLNDDMDDFAAKPGSPNLFGLLGGDANAIAPGKRPLSSMTPTIVTQDGKFFAALGAPGGSTITTGVLEVLLDLLDFHMHAQAAVDLPRFHQQWRPDVLSLEPGFSPTVRQGLVTMGYTLRPIEAVGRVEVILNRDGELEGAYDKRGDGKVASY